MKLTLGTIELSACFSNLENAEIVHRLVLVTYLESPPRVESSSSDLDVLSDTFVKPVETNDISSGRYEPAFAHQLDENFGLEYEKATLSDAECGMYRQSVMFDFTRVRLKNVQTTTSSE